MPKRMNKLTTAFRLTPLYILFGLFLLVSNGCTSNKALTGTPPLRERSAAFLLRKLNTHRIDAPWFSTKASITFASEAETRHFTSYIRIQRDSLIWMNFKKSSIEAARLMITPDSFFLINRLEKVYFAAGFDYLQERLALPAFDNESLTPFRALQELFLGNPVFPALRKMDVQAQESRYLLEGSGNTFDAHYFLDGKNHTLDQLHFFDQRYNRKIQFSFGDYQPLEQAKNFSYFRVIQLNTPEDGTVSLELKLTKAAFHAPKTIQFEIPPHYERMENRLD